MATTKSYQCLSCRLKTLSLRPQRRRFHASSPANARKTRYPNFKPSDLEAQPEYRPYTAREKKLLALKYTPAQMRVIEAGEEAISAKDIAEQGRMRTDPLRIKYLDDFATMRPALDRPVEAKDLEEKEEADSGRGEGLKEGRNFDSPRERGRRQRQEREEEVEEPDPHMLRLSQQTGLSKQEISRLRVKNLVNHRVVNQTRMGKIQSLYYLTIAGNQDGMVGVGEGKAAEDEDGRRQAMMNAIRNMKPIPRYEERTIYGDVEAKVGATVVKLSSRPPGTPHLSSLSSQPLRANAFSQDSGIDVNI